jgi:hypothetical protein
VVRAQVSRTNPSETCAGYDEEGAEQLKRVLVDTKKWIGAAGWPQSPFSVLF